MMVDRMSEPAGGGIWTWRGAGNAAVAFLSDKTECGFYHVQHHLMPTWDDMRRHLAEGKKNEWDELWG